MRKIGTNLKRKNLKLTEEESASIIAKNEAKVSV